MSYLVRKQKVSHSRFTRFTPLLGMVMLVMSCGQKEGSPPAVVQKTFASPDDAGAALVEAAKSNDQGALLAIFGPDSKDVVSSGDAVKDKDALQGFVAAYNQMHRWNKIKAGGQMLVIGTDNYVYPVPLGQNSSGQWVFDTAAGKDEILARRIGRDELTAIAACSAAAEAEQQFLNQTHDGDKLKQYSLKFVSDSGKQNGLYWNAAEGQTPSPLGLVGDFAKAVGYTSSGDKPQPFNGYYFRILTRQGDKAEGGAKDYLVDGKLTGGFAILAYPTEYRNSGIMTFIVGKDGVVYQKDLGEKTAEIAAAMTEYNPGDGWKPAL
jgi:hypothetical protein